MFYKNVGVTWRVSDCEELVGELLTGDGGGYLETNLALALLKTQQVLQRLYTLLNRLSVWVGVP